MNSGKYSLIGISEECFKRYNPMVDLQHRVRLCIARSYNIEGFLKKYGYKEEIRKKIERISLLQQDNIKDHEVNEKKEEGDKKHEPLKKYLETLTVKIEKELSPV